MAFEIFNISSALFFKCQVAENLHTKFIEIDFVDLSVKLNM
jgi:hypothetical protein